MNTPGYGRPTRTGSRFLEAALSLQCKATVLVVALTLTAVAGVSGYFLHSGIQLARRQHNEQLVELAAMLAGNAAEKLAAGDFDALQTLAEDVANGRPLVCAVFSGAEKREVARAEHGDLGPGEHPCNWRIEEYLPATPVYHEGPEGGRGFLSVMYPVNLRDMPAPSSTGRETKLVGYVRLDMAADTWRRGMLSKLDLVIGVGSIVTAVVIPLGFLLVRRIVSPLEGLALAMHRFSQGRLNVRSPSRRRDEIGRLAEAFNRMADQHQQTHERIVRLNADLEERVTERTRQLRELAARDPLTGLYNRRHFNEVLKRSFSEAVRYDNALSCIMIDLDDFKAVNDTSGHRVGDELLGLVASTITSQLRASDIPARFGGDEFVILLPHTAVDRAAVLGGRIVEKLDHDLAARLPGVHAGLSMGIASAPAPEVRDADSLVRAADRALYEAKAAGKNRIVAAPTAEHAPV